MNQPVTAETLPPSDRWTPERRWLMFCVLGGATLATVDGAIANVALPTLSRAFGASEAATVWVVNGYQLAVAMFLLPAAALGEILGHRPVYLGGLLVFTVASLCCAASPSLDVLVAARVIQGAAGACLAALGPALVREITPHRLLGRGFAAVSLTVAVSSAAGPTIAALILSLFSWRWLFLVNGPIGLLLLAAYGRMAPAGRRSGGRFDLSGAVLSAVSLGLVVAGIDELGGSRPGPWAAAIVAGLVGFVLLLRQQRHREAPILPLDLLRIPLFALSIFASICAYSAQILAFVSLPFLFQGAMHHGEAATGLLVTPWPLAVAAAAPVAGRLAGRHSAAVLGSAGLGLVTLGLLLLATMPAGASILAVCWRMAVCGLGFGFFQTPNNHTVMTAGPPRRGAAAGGMLAVARTVGWCFGSALTALLFAMRGPAAVSGCLFLATFIAAAGTIISACRFERKA